jgi:protein-S-isoprenylcysteine O-methyltransferase Ste14
MTFSLQQIKLHEIPWLLSACGIILLALYALRLYAAALSTQVVVLDCALGIGWIFVQARLEELDLLQRMPAYQEYMNRVPRFLPHLR